MDLWMLLLLLPLALVATSFLKGYRSPARLREMAEAIASGAPVIDVRTPGEFASGHYRRARNIPVEALGGRLEEVGAPDEPVVLYCRSGSRSGQARRLLMSRGYTKVYDLGPFRNTERLPAVPRAEREPAAPPPSRNQRKRQRRRETGRA